MQTRIPCTIMRGGTSKGPFFLKSDLPADPGLRDRVLLRVMGSPDRRQIDGLGGADSLTSKVAIVSRSDRADADVDYFFAQVVVDKAVVDTNPTCGNMLSGIAPFAIEKGLVPAGDPETRVRIYLVNTDTLVEAIVQTPGGEVTYEGGTAIDGVPGTAAPVRLAFVGAVGSKTGKLLPTGGAKDTIGGIEISCVDVAMPMVIARAADLGKTGHESKAELDADKDFFARIEPIRLEAARRMGMGDARDSVVPKFAIVAPPKGGAGIAARYFTPWDTHAAMAVTGGSCIACTTAIAGSVADGLAEVSQGETKTVVVEHPSGVLSVEIVARGDPSNPEIERAAVLRTTRPLMEGVCLVPASVWAGREAATEEAA